MGGIEWQALPIICDILGVCDVDNLVYQLIAIRDSMRKKDG
jgi:hypothetical protein